MVKGGFAEYQAYRTIQDIFTQHGATGDLDTLYEDVLQKDIDVIMPLHFIMTAHILDVTERVNKKKVNMKISVEYVADERTVAVRY